MPARQYAPKRVRVGEFTADATMHQILGTSANKRLVSSLIFNNLSTTTDATLMVVLATSTPANGTGGIKLTVPNRANLSYTSHAELTALTLEAGWGIWFRVDVGATGVTAECHYMEEFVGAPVVYDPKSLWYSATASYAAVISPSASKRRIITSVNGFCDTGTADTSWYLYTGTGSPGTDTHGLRWAGLGTNQATNMMSSQGVPLHLDLNDGLYARCDSTGSTVKLQVNYMEQQ